jgi:isopentenyl-diphosphate Delta-isomerase
MNTLDSVILVDENDHPIGVMDKLQAHRNGARLHRATSVFLFGFYNNEVCLLLQKRSLGKIVGADKWANTACGNVRPGESYLECAYRRLQEELGFKRSLIDSCQIRAVYKFSYSIKCNQEFSEREIDQVYVGWIPDNNMIDFSSLISVNPSEVQDYTWANYSRLKLEFQKNKLPLTPWFELMLDNSQLQNVIKSYLENQQ